MTTFNVTYEPVTPESAEDGEAAEQGWIAENINLRDALNYLRATRTSRVDGVECIEPNSSGPSFDWITVTNGMEYETGAQESRSLHIPRYVTDASRVRIARLLGIRMATNFKFQQEDYT